MTWPTSVVATTNLDSASDSAALARADLLQAVQNLNMMRAWIGADEVPMAAAATVDVGGQISNRIVLSSGGGAITSLGANYGGAVFVRVAVGCSLAYNATTLVTPAGASITLRAGDWFMAIPKASGGASNGWFVIPAPFTGGLTTNGASPAPGTALTLGRSDTGSEGGQMDYCRASDNTVVFSSDVFNFLSQECWRLIDTISGSVRICVDGSGRFGVNQMAALTSPMDINGDCMRIRIARTPASATAPGNAGEWCNDASYFYVCTATNTWKRTALATW